MSVIEQALRLTKDGISVIPIRPDGTKAPAIREWKSYQKKIANPEALEPWFSNGNGIAVIGGKVSGNLEILDFDDPDAAKSWTDLLKEEGYSQLLEKLPVVMTPTGGFHVYYRCEEPVEGNQKLAQKNGPDGQTEVMIETRGEGGYVVAPGSPRACHSNGKLYELVRGDLSNIPRITAEERTRLLDAARSLNAIIKPKRIVRGPSAGVGNRPGDDFNQRGTWEEILTPHGWEPVRNRGETTDWRRPGKGHGISATTNHAGSDLLYNFSSNGHPFESETAYSKFAAYTLLNHNDDFKAAARALASEGYGENTTSDISDKEKPTQAQLLIELASNVELFTTPELDCYATLPNDGHAETWSIKSKAFRRWMMRRFYETESKPPGAQALQDALNFLEAKAQFDGPTYPINTRLAWHNGNFYLDLADEQWRVVEVTPSGWSVVSTSPVKFRRTAGMMPLPEPVNGGSINELRSLVNFGSESNWKLIVSWLVAALRPDGPYPVLTLYGEQGSAKSSQELLLRSLIDPSSAPLRTVPRDERDLMIAARNGWVIALDNLSDLPNWLSDGLCRLATGGGFTTRRLYTDDEEEIFDAQRPVILNGITTIATRADLVDRSINIDLPQIPDEKRRPEKEIHAEFERVRPQVLGALLDAVSAGLKNYSLVTLDSLPRMADFAKWIVACEPALGWECGEFMKVYGKNREGSIECTLDADPLASAIRALMEDIEEWKGQPSELLEELEKIVDERTKRSKVWPGSPNWLTRKLKRPATFLRSVGIDIQFPDQSREKKRQITITVIRKSTQNTVDSVDTDVSSLNFHENKELYTVGPKVATSGKPSISKALNGNVGIDDKNPTHSSSGEQVDGSTVSEAKDREVFEF